MAAAAVIAGRFVDVESGCRDQTMQKFVKETGLVAPLDRSNVDTDQIIPKQYLKSIKRTGLVLIF